MNSYCRILAAAILPIGLAAPASAITVTFNVEVTESSISLPDIDDGPSATLPALGTLGIVTIDLPGVDVSNTMLIGDPNAPPNAGSVLASLSVGSLSTQLEPGAGSVAFAGDTSIRFANGSFSSILVDFPRDPMTSGTYAGSFRLETPADGFIPTTFGDVASALIDPNTSLFFSFNGTTFDGIDTSFRVDSVAAVPLPGSALLLGTALLGTAAYRRRRAPRRY